MRQPSKLLMVDPVYFDVKYAINPHMLDATGRIHVVDRSRARGQWEALRETFISLGKTVDVLPGVVNLPDMVFAANQSLVFESRDAKPKVHLSKMHASERRDEVQYFRNYFQQKGYEILPKSFAIEGTGDAIFNWDRNILFGGYGFRSTKDAYKELMPYCDAEIIPLQLVHPDFYHMDTCFSVLSKDCVAVVNEAFSAESLEKIRHVFGKVISIDRDEAKKFFAGNCFALPDKTVILQKGAIKFVAALRAHGFSIRQVDTSEFIKAGGSVFCMKMEIY